MHRTSLSQGVAKRYNGKSNVDYCRQDIVDYPRSRIMGSQAIGTKYNLLRRKSFLILEVHQTSDAIAPIEISMGTIDDRGNYTPRIIMGRDRVAISEIAEYLGVEPKSLLRHCTEFARKHPTKENRTRSQLTRKKTNNARSRNAKNYKRLSSIAIR